MKVHDLEEAGMKDNNYLKVSNGCPDRHSKCEWYFLRAQVAIREWRRQLGRLAQSCVYTNKTKNKTHTNTKPLHAYNWWCRNPSSNIENAELEIHSLIHWWKQGTGKERNEVQRVSEKSGVFRGQGICVHVCGGSLSPAEQKGRLGLHSKNSLHAMLQSWNSFIRHWRIMKIYFIPSSCICQVPTMGQEGAVGNTKTV